MSTVIDFLKYFIRVTCSSPHCCPPPRLKISARKYAVISNINHCTSKCTELSSRTLCDAQYTAENAGNVAKGRHTLSGGDVLKCDSIQVRD
jgi:hypothetical protein